MHCTLEESGNPIAMGLKAVCISASAPPALLPPSGHDYPMPVTSSESRSSSLFGPFRQRRERYRARLSPTSAQLTEVLADNIREDACIPTHPRAQGARRPCKLGRSSASLARRSGLWQVRE